MSVPADELIDLLRAQAAAAERSFVAAAVADLRRQQVTAPLQSVRDEAASKARRLVDGAIGRKPDSPASQGSVVSGCKVS